MSICPYLKDKDVFCCPNLLSGIKNWAGWVDAGYTGYFFLNNFAADPSRGRLFGPRLIHTKPSEAMAMDFIFGPGFSQGTEAQWHTAHRRGANVLLVDGGVKFQPKEWGSFLYHSGKGYYAVYTPGEAINNNPDNHVIESTTADGDWPNP